MPPVDEIPFCPVDQLVADHARRDPDALAVSGPVQGLSYGQLDRAADALAQRLGPREPEEPVALCLDRSPALLAAYVGVLRTGASVLALDPSWPTGRIAAAIDAAGARLVIDEPVDLDPRPVAPTQAKHHFLQLATRVQTSGSTGVPKSVGVTHGALARRALTHAAARALTPADRASWLVPAGASAAAAEIWPVLAAGASLHAPDPASIADPLELRDWMLDTAITVAFVGMPLAERLWRLSWPSSCALRLLCTGGDAVRQWASPELPFAVAVEYGSAEANGVTSGLAGDAQTSFTVSAVARRSRPTIGRAWPGVSLYTDRGGELSVVSPELARGYLNDPRATAERFVPAAGGARALRTGDLVSFDDAGLLFHHGRTDAQLKIAGQRVEPAEIEAVLLAHPGVADAAVHAVAGPTGDQVLSAHIVYLGAERPDLRAWCADRLPSALIPAVFAPLDALPLGPTGKVDRAALPTVDWKRSDAFEPVDGDAADALVNAVWSEVLGAPPAAAEEHLFRSGGTSLAAGQIAMLLRERSGVRVRLRDLARDPTPAAIATLIRGRLTTAGQGASMRAR